MKKRVGLLALMLFFAAGLIVFAGGQKEKGAETEGTGTVTVWKMGGSPKEVEFWPVVTEKFSAQHPEVKIEYNYFYGQIRRSKIIGGYQADNLADVVVAFGQDIPDFAGLRIIQPLDDVDAEMVNSWKENIVPEVFDVTMYRGKQYALPTYVDMAPFLAYNLDDLEHAGLSGPPATWSDVKEYAAKMTQPNRPGIALQATLVPVDLNIFEGIAFNNGGRFLDESTGEIAFNKPGFVDSLQLYVDLVEAGVTNGNLTEDNFKVGAALFGENKAAMWIGMSWLITPWFGKDVEGLRWQGTAFPRADRVSGGYEPAAAVMDPTAALMITSTCKNPKAALKYLDFWAQPEQLNLWGGQEEICRVPAGKAAYDLPELAEAWPQWVELYKQGTLFEGAISVPRFLGITGAEPELGKALQKAILGKASAQAALDEAAKAAQEYYDILHE